MPGWIPFEVFSEAYLRKRTPRALPRLIRMALGLVWEADRRGFLAAFFQILGAAMSALLVLAGKLAIDAVLAAQSGTATTSALVPVVVLIALVTAVGSASSSLQAQQQRLLGEHVSATAWGRLLDVTGRVNLEFFESPRFFE